MKLSDEVLIIGGAVVAVVIIFLIVEDEIKSGVKAAGEELYSEAKGAWNTVKNGVANLVTPDVSPQFGSSGSEGAIAGASLGFGDY